MSNRRIVHESEMQRQHVRFAVPVIVKIGADNYETKDFSAGGISVLQIKQDQFGEKKRFPVTLRFAFAGFGLDLDIEAECSHYDAAEQIMGCRFVNLSPQTISVIRYILTSYLNGDLVTADGLLHVQARNNFFPARNNQGREAPYLIRQIAGMTIVMLILCTVLYFFGWNIHDRLFVIKATQAYIDQAGSSGKTHVTALVDTTAAYRLSPGDPVTIRIADMREAIAGVVETIKSSASDPLSVIYGHGMPMPATVHILPETDLPATLLYRPVDVRFIPR